MTLTYFLFDFQASSLRQIDKKFSFITISVTDIRIIWGMLCHLRLFDVELLLTCTF